MNVPTLIESLSPPGAYPHPVDAVEVHQTHISVVFLAGPFAYKIKKPVNLGFVDFSTLEKRRHFCDEEVRLNRRLAPHVYLGVVPITMAEEHPRFDGAGPAIEWAVKMKRLPSDATLEHHLERGDVTSEHLRALAARLANFHRHAESNERISSFGRFDVVAANARENFAQTATHVGRTVSAAVYERVRELNETHLTTLYDLIDARASRGVPRDTHGDLHLDHVYLFPEDPPNDLVIVDCIEFADRFRFADPVADMAFLAMDLTFHGRRDLARIFADAYFEAVGDAEGRRLFAFYMAYRALVRGKVEGIELDEPEVADAERLQAQERARAHWLLALGELETPANRPALVLMAGLPGSGKSTLAHSLAQSANFSVLRSDVIRKELAGVSASVAPADFETGIYGDAWTERTYAELHQRAEQRLWQGERVMIDANFRDDQRRQPFFDAARRWGVPVLFIHCKAAPEVTRARLQARKHDASDADLRIYECLRQTWQPVTAEWQRRAFPLDASGSLAENEQQLQSILRQEGLLAS